MAKAIYAFSGDPITFGHIDVITRAARNFDKLVVGIGVNPGKNYMFSLEERLRMAKKATEHLQNVEVVSFKGLLIDYAYEQGISAIVKGVRNITDFDYENNLRLHGETQKLGIETYLLFADPRLAHISSSGVKAMLAEHAFIQDYVPIQVKQNLEARMKGQYIIGITGEPGCGKSYLSEKFVELGKKYGIPVHNIELDHIGHHILSDLDEPSYVQVREQIISNFGDTIKNPDGSINRSRLGEIVFNDPSALEKLNTLMKTPLHVRLKRELYDKKGIILFNAALIAESDMSYLSNNNVLLVGVDKETQLGRLQKRNLTEEQIFRRLESQHDYTEKKQILQDKIKQDRHGVILDIDTSKGASDELIEKKFREMVRSTDIYYELRFKSLMHRLGAKVDADAEYKKIVEAYNVDSKHYHTLQHIVEMENTLEDAKEHYGDTLDVNYDDLQLETVFHDIDPSEEKSAKIAYDFCMRAGFDEGYAKKIHDGILPTKHSIAPTTIEAQLICDPDLMILGNSPARFDEYEQQVRKEYEHVPDRIFKVERAKILKRFLEREAVYCTEYFKDRYEHQARMNLQRSIEKLTGTHG
jgi:pantetheine-phosphate adenylyltransferase/dephospho-CoA kinase